MSFPHQYHFDQRVTYHIDYSDLQDLVQELYGKSVEMGSANDTTHEFNVSKEKGSDDMHKALEKGFMEAWDFSEVLSDMCYNGHIAPGEYFVRVSW